MHSIAHPSVFIDAEKLNSIRNYAAEAEKLKQLHPKQLELIYTEQWFNLYVPKIYNGLELSLQDGLHIEEALAWVDGSTGWTVTLCSSANWFAGFLQQAAAEKLFGDVQVCFAGSGKTSGIATVTEHGYNVTGQWHYATGAPHATVFTVNCTIEKDGAILQTEQKTPLIKSFWFYKHEVTVLQEWNCTGMIATASEGFEVKNLPIGPERCFIIKSSEAVLNHPLYQYPFLQFAEATLAVNSSGMAVRFIDLCSELFQTKYETHKPAVTSMINQKLEACMQQLHNARKLFYAAVETSWNMLIAQQMIEEALLNTVSITSRSLAEIARKVIDDLYPYCGIIAATSSSEINRVWRNMHTASQHALLLLPYDKG